MHFFCIYKNDAPKRGSKKFNIFLTNSQISLTKSEDHHNDKRNVSCKFHQNPSWGRSFPLLVVPFPSAKFQISPTGILMKFARKVSFDPLQISSDILMENLKLVRILMELWQVWGDIFMIVQQISAQNRTPVQIFNEDDFRLMFQHEPFFGFSLMITSSTEKKIAVWVSFRHSLPWAQKYQTIPYQTRPDQTREILRIRVSTTSTSLSYAIFFLSLLK